jgi:ribosomal protein S27AE
MNDDHENEKISALRQESRRLMFLAEERVRLQAENENLKAKIDNRDLNIRHLTKLLKLAGTVRFNIEDTTSLESNSCAHCDVEMEYLYQHEKREVCGRCENILEQDPTAFQ